MQNLQLSVEEAEALQEVLRRIVAELDLELLHTDSREYKQVLKHRRELLDGVSGKLNSMPVTA